MALNGCYDWLAEKQPGRTHGAGSGGIDRTAPSFSNLAQVSAGAEGPFRAGENRRVQLVIAIESLKSLRQFTGRGFVHRVPRVRTVDRDDQDFVVAVYKH